MSLKAARAWGHALNQLPDSVFDKFIDKLIKYNKEQAKHNYKFAPMKKEDK